MLHDLYKSVFLSFYQIKEGHFEKQARPTVYNRLSKLSHAGLLKSFSVNLQAHHRRHEDVGVLYKITKQGISVLKTYLPHLVLRMEPAPINMSALSHDLMLTDVLRKLEKGFPEWKVLNSKIETKANEMMSKLPDAVMKNPTSSEEIAIELELTAKSEKRYRDIVLS
ncbi:MAG: replication-relaxation family protein, partial [Bdellovibrionales bacterium]|nr:replication-relaxation family protein [Bdellovibrionales bacterium]